MGLAVGGGRAVKNEIAGFFVAYLVLGAGLTVSWWLVGLAGELDYALRRLWYKMVSKDPLDPPREPPSRDQELLKMFGYFVACGVLGAVFVDIVQILTGLGTPCALRAIGPRC